MQFLDEQDNPLSSHLQQSVSLLNSRHRLDCQPSQTSRIISDNDCEQQMRQFLIQIQQKFKVSIANKIYTFPRVIHSLHDIITSSDQSDQEYQHDREMLKNLERESKQTVKDMIKIKTRDHIRSDKSSDKFETIDYRQTALKSQKNHGKGLQKSKDKAKSKIRNSKKKEEMNTTSKQRLSLKKVASDFKHKKRQDRIKTQVEPLNMVQNIKGRVRKI